MSADSILDDPFHACAFAAFVDEAREQGRMPDSEAVRQRAYRYYEQELVKKDRTPEGQAEP